MKDKKEPRGFMECPKCGGRCVWRRGVHFEHEVRCIEGCGSFDPHELWQQEQEERLSFNTHKE